MEERARIPVGPPVANPLPAYWHEPKSPLANVIEAEPDKGTKTFDYVIVGSGISGTLIAYNILSSHPDASIVMLEAREACGGATSRNGGHTKAASYRSYLRHREEVGKEEALKIARLEYENILATHRLAEELELDCGNQLCNTVDLIYDQGTFDAGKEAIQAIRQDASEEDRKEGGMAWYQTYSPEEACKKFWASPNNTNPAVQKDEHLVGAFEYLAGRVNAYRFTTGILNHCTQKGLQLCTHTPVHKILPVPSPAPSSPGYEVFTQYSTIRAHSVILATNGYTPYLLPTLQSSIVPLRGQITTQRLSKSTVLPSPLPTTYSFIYKSGYEYMVPRPLADGSQHIVIGGGLGRQPHNGITEYGNINDGALNPDISKYLHGSLAGYFGKSWGDDEPDTRVVQEWTGIMGATADGLPFVGEVPGTRGMYVSAGFNGHGMVLCLKAAQALADIIGGVDPRDINWFPQSFLISEGRVGKARFRGRTDLGMAETETQ